MTTATRPVKSLEQQIKDARARARKAAITLVMIGQGAQGFKAKVSSERDASTEYTITRDQATGNLVCTCPAQVICKHIGRVLLEGTAYHSDACPASSIPPTPERQGYTAQEARHDLRPMKWNQQHGCYEVIDQPARPIVRLAPLKAQARQYEDW